MKAGKKTLILSITALMLFSTVTQAFATENNGTIVNETQVSESILNVDNDIVDEKVVDESIIDKEMLPTSEHCGNWSTYKAGTPYCDSPVCGNPFSGLPTNYQILYQHKKCIDGNGNTFYREREITKKLGCC